MTALTETLHLFIRVQSETDDGGEDHKETPINILANKPGEVFIKILETCL